MVLGNVELQATCSALGYLEDSNYIKEPDCLETVKDLIRYLKREDETCDIRRQLGSAQIVQNDLIPILISYKDDATLFDTVMRLLVNLTQPAYICFNNHIPELKDLHNNYMEVISTLISYKQAFASEALFAILTKKLGDLLQLDWEHRQEEDTILIERILILVRNILHIPPDPEAEKRTDDDASIHDQVLWALHTSGMEDLLLYVSSTDDERQFAMHVVEVISLMFREQTPEQLASAGAKRTLTEKERDEKELMMVREKERAQKKMNMMKYSTRHSRFGGTYVLKNVKSISDNNNMIYHRSLGDAKNQTYDLDKRPKKKSKNLAAVTDSETIRRSTLSIRLFLKDFCVQFLENCYNPLMYAVKDGLNHKKTQENDETYYLWAMRFFMEFQRHYDFRVDTISETMSNATFHYVQVQLTTYHEMILTEKKEAITWSKRMHIALRAYKELLHTLMAMGESKDEQLIGSAKVLKSNIFYLMEYRDIFLILFKKFKQNKQSRSFLKDLVEATHLFIKMLEGYSKTNKHAMVQKTKKKKPKKKAMKKSQCTAEESQFTEEELENMWDSVSSDLSSTLQGRGEIPDDIAPFDAASEVEIEQQRADAMLRIQDTLREQKPGEALALLRAAREVWPEQDVFGSEDISPEEEFGALREIFMTYIPRTVDNQVPEEEDNNELDEEEQEELEMHTQTSEAEFDFMDFIRKFANGAVLKPYILLLSEFKKNSLQTNHYIIKMLHRVAVDCKTVGLLFQIALFRIFQNFYKDPSSKIRHYKEMAKFGVFVLKKFFEASKNNEKIFMEIWFWKNVKESLEVVEGYGTYTKQSGPQIWTEEQEMELTALFEEYKDKEEPGMDTIDHVMMHIMDQTKSRRQIIRRLIHLNLIGSSTMYRKKQTGSRAWQEEQIDELRTLYETYKDCEDPLGDIINNMSHKRTKPKIVEKLQELGLVGEDQQLYKRRQRGAGGRRKRRSGSDSSDKSSSEKDSDSEGPEATEPEISEDSPSSSSSSEEEVPEGGEGDAGPDVADLPNTGPVGKYLKQLADQGLSEQVTWMQDYLRRTAIDREDDDDGEPTPIVTFTEESEEAMENKSFKSMLKKLDIRPPVNEQEKFWRIPGELTPAELRDRADWLKPDFKGKGLASTDRFNKLASMAKKKAKEERRKAREEKRRLREERRKAREERLANKELRQQRRQENMELKMLRKEEKLRKAELKRKKIVEENAPKQFKSAEFVPSDFDDSSSDDNQPIVAECLRASPEKQVVTNVRPTRPVSSESSSLSSLSEFDDAEERPASASKKKTKRTTTRKKKTPASDDEASMSNSASSVDPNLENLFPITSSDDEAENISLADLHKKVIEKKKSPAKKSSAKRKKSPVKKARKSPVKKSRLKRSLPSSSSDKDSDEERLVIDSPINTSQPKKRTRFMAADSESDEDTPVLDLDAEGGRDMVDGDDAETGASFPATLFTQPPASDSDSDIEDHIPLRRVIRRKQIESDSDD